MVRVQGFLYPKMSMIESMCKRFSYTTDWLGFTKKSFVTDLLLLALVAPSLVSPPILNKYECKEMMHE